MAIAGTIILVPYRFKSSHYNSFEDWAPKNEIYSCQISKGVAFTWQDWGDTRIVATQW